MISPLSARISRLLIALALIGFAALGTARAFDASSTSLFVRQAMFPISGGTAQYSFSTSTTFKSTGIGGGVAIGTSSSATLQVEGGYMYNFYKGPAPAYAQTHYHWRNDDGSETTATSKTSGTQDTAITSVAKLGTDRLRVEISNEGGTKAGYAPQQFRIEYGILVTTCSAVSSWTDVGAVAGDWDMVNTANLTDGGNTTNLSVSTGGVFDENHTFISQNSAVKDASSQTAAISVSSDSFIEIEYALQPLSAATDGATYCFRVTNAGSATNYVYSVYPQATIAGGSLTFTVDGSAEAFPSVTPGTVSATTSILSVTTSNATGFNVTVQRSDSTGTMSLGPVYIPDKTNWSSPGATTTNGNATASTTEPLTLQFRMRQTGTDVPNYSSAWWGSADTTAAALFAGFPASPQQIANRSTAAGSGTSMTVLYNLNVPVTQKNGSYSGAITYTVTAN